MNYWLMKSEPNAYSIDDLIRDGRTGWDGVRNYQARNIMRDQMQVGDLALFYHSNAKPPGVAGICRICETGLLDDTAWDPKSPYYDPKASKGDTVWVMVAVEFVEKFERLISLHELKERSDLEGMMLLKKGARLSVQPVSEEHFNAILALR